MRAAVCRRFDIRWGGAPRSSYTRSAADKHAQVALGERTYDEAEEAKPQAPAGAPAPEPGAVRSAYRRAIRAAYRDPVELGDLAVDGDDLRAAGIPAGPLLGKILHALLERVVEDPSLNTREQLLALARGLPAQWGGGDGAPPSAQH